MQTERLKQILMTSKKSFCHHFGRKSNNYDDQEKDKKKSKKHCGAPPSSGRNPLQKNPDDQREKKSKMTSKIQ